MYYAEGGSIMVWDKIADRAFFIDHRIGTNTRGQVFESIKGERFPLRAEDHVYVADLLSNKATDAVLVNTSERDMKLKKRYYEMIIEILVDAGNSVAKLV